MDLAQKRETYDQADHSWLVSAHGTDVARSGTLLVSTLTENTHYPDGYLPAGTPLCQIEASKRFGIYDNAATDGREVGFGFTLEPVKISDTATTVVVAILWHGAVNHDNLPFAIDAGFITDVEGRILVVSSEQGGS